MPRPFTDTSTLRVRQRRIPCRPVAFCAFNFFCDIVACLRKRRSTGSGHRKFPAVQRDNLHCRLFH